jgi:hypothetical protein
VSGEFEYPYKTLDEVFEAYAAAERDVKGDYPEGTWEGGGFYEIVQTLAGDCPEDVGREFCRIEGVRYPDDEEDLDFETFEETKKLPPLTTRQKKRIAERMERRKIDMSYGQGLKGSSTWRST